MHAEAKALLTTGDMKKRLAAEGADPINSTPPDFTTFVKSEMQQWSEVGRAAKIQPAD
jgi:tripartite-type tricarboxylate transporter receptor subunit TctC